VMAIRAPRLFRRLLRPGVCLFFSVCLAGAGKGAELYPVCDSDKIYTSWNNCVGSVVLVNGNRYEGLFQAGIPNGQGSALFGKGFRYIGQFKDSQYDGLGILVDRGMKVLQAGLWANGKFVEERTIDASALIAYAKQYSLAATQTMGVERTSSVENSVVVASSLSQQRGDAISNGASTIITDRRKPVADRIIEEVVPMVPREPSVDSVILNDPKRPFSIKPTAAGKGVKLALVIGNDTYLNIGKLRNAREDAKAMAETLQRMSYRVTLKLDVNQKEMKASIRNFANAVQGGDEVIIFFAGHGVQIQGANYLLPVDLEVENEVQIKDDAVQLQRILDDMTNSKAKLTVAIIDACRNNPLPQSNGRSLGGRGLATTTAATGQMIIFSAGSGQQALDRLGPNDVSKNGLFTRIFVKEMQKPGVAIDRVLKNVRVEVVEKAKSVNHEQVPAIYDQVVGDFYFNE